MLIKEENTVTEGLSVQKEMTEEKFMCTLDDPEIKNEEGYTVYNLSKFDFLNEGKPDYDHVNKNLWKHSRKVNKHGLFEIWDNTIYQIRNFNLANLTLIKSNTGWIVVDVLSDAVTATAAIQLAENKLGVNILDNIKGIIVTHSHVDHFGGLKALASQSQIGKDGIPFFAPKGFYENSISENLMGGNTMGRRAQYMYGSTLEASEIGTVGVGLGQANSKEPYGILRPSTEISDDITGYIDGLEFNFMYTPDSEAPSEMIFYIPKHQVICQGEIVNKTMHNLYTLRGAKVRNGLLWSNYLNQAINNWTSDVKMSFGTHHWPTYTKADIVKLWSEQRDMYRFIHDQTLRLANQGYTPDEIADEITELPKGLSDKMQNHGFYGTLSHNLKAQYQLYFGWFDGNPANLNPLAPVKAAKKYIEYMGGEKAIMIKAHDDFKKGNYRWLAEILNHVVFNNPANSEARILLAKTYTKLGFAAESGPWRNFYLTGAEELKGLSKDKVLPKKQKGTSPGIVNNLSLQNIADYFAIRFDGVNNSEMAFNFKFKIIDNDYENELKADEPLLKSSDIHLYVGNGVVIPNSVKNAGSGEEIEVAMLRSDLNKLFLERVTVDELLNENKIYVTPHESEAHLRSFAATFVAFDPNFNIIEP